MGTIRKITKSPKIVKFQICPDSETRSKGQNHESRNREIAKSRNREKVYVLSGHRTPRSMVRIPNREIAKSRNREIAKKVTCPGREITKKSHVLAGLRTPRSGVRIPNREIAKSRNREIAKKSHVMTGLRTPRSGVRITNREIAKSRNRKKNPCPVRAPDRWSLSRIAKSRNREITKSRNREIAKSLMNYQGRWFLNQGSH